MSLVQSILIIGATYSPFVLAQVAMKELNPFDLLLQAPILGILVFVVWLFLKDRRDAETRRAERETELLDERRKHEEALEARRLEMMSKMGDECHTVQRDAITVMKEVKEHMQADAEIRGRTLEIISRLESQLNQRDRV